MVVTENTRSGVEAVRGNAGVWSREDHAFVRFTGPDVASWLQTQTTNDVKALQSGQGHANALLDRKGRLQAHFSLHRWEDEYWLIVEKAQATRLLRQLEEHLFLERVQWADAGAEVEEVLLQGPRSVLLLATLIGDDAAAVLPREPYACAPVQAAGYPVLCFRMSVTGEDGYLLVAQAGEAEPFLEGLLALGASPVDAEAREILRIEAGIPRFGIDMDSTFRIPETTLEREAVSYTKGCYLGQEVVARLKAYASPKQALMGLVFDADAAPPALNTHLLLDGKRVGEVKSGVFSPTLERPIALAYLDREHRVPGARLAFDSGDRAEVVVLPFHHVPSREERARALYDEALGVFERDLQDEDDSAIGLLKETVLLDPDFEDAFEALGVILNRHGRVDEAIHFMKLLESLNPNCVMAHTNLSVFYVAKGMIEEAETEKAKAAVLQIRKSSEARKAEEMAATERERIRREAAERIEMFKEVLDIDPDDPLATFGMGVAHIQLDEYEKAIPFLEHATRVSKDYSAAYLHLGKCFEFTRQFDRARETFRKGIEVATRKGDLMPLREMERRLNALPISSAGAPPFSHLQ